jgi:hypothetical protein
MLIKSLKGKKLKRERYLIRYSDYRSHYSEIKRQIGEDGNIFWGERVVVLRKLSQEAIRLTWELLINT